MYVSFSNSDCIAREFNSCQHSHIICSCAFHTLGTSLKPTIFPPRLPNKLQCPLDVLFLSRGYSVYRWWMQSNFAVHPLKLRQISLIKFVYIHLLKSISSSLTNYIFYLGSEVTFFFINTLSYRTLRNQSEPVYYYLTIFL